MWGGVFLDRKHKLQWNTRSSISPDESAKVWPPYSRVSQIVLSTVTQDSSQSVSLLYSVWKVKWASCARKCSVESVTTGVILQEWWEFHREQCTFGLLHCWSGKSNVRFWAHASGHQLEGENTGEKAEQFATLRGASSHLPTEVQGQRTGELFPTARTMEDHGFSDEPNGNDKILAAR